MSTHIQLLLLTATTGYMNCYKNVLNFNNKKCIIRKHFINEFNLVRTVSPIYMIKLAVVSATVAVPFIDNSPQ